MVLQNIKNGVQQIIDRASVSDIGVLVIDKDAFDLVYNSNKKQEMIDELNRLENVRNELNQQKTFYRIEPTLNQDAHNAFHALKDRIKNL